jgi:putative hemolysin
MGLSEILVISSMLVFNGLFAGYELALASVSLGRLKDLAEKNRRGAAAALYMKGRMEASLAVVQIGITLVGAVAAATVGASAEETIAPWLQTHLPLSDTLSEILALSTVVIAISSFTIIVGELVPKTIAIKNSEAVCLALSPVMRVISRVFYPPVLAFEWCTRLIVRAIEKMMPSFHGTGGDMGLVELRAQARALRTNLVINDEQEKIILGASNLPHITVADIMVPAEDMVMLNAGDTLPDHFITVHLEAYTRFPVAQAHGDPGSVIGYVNVKELIFLAKAHPENPDIRQIVRPMRTFEGGTTIGEAFGSMMHDHQHMALVSGPGGAVKGLITLEDILEEVVGDIQDEFDRLPKHCTGSGRQFVAGGGVSLGVLRDRTGHPDLGAGRSAETTLSEWVTEAREGTLKGGDAVEIDGVRILVRKMRRHRLREALIDTMLAGRRD